MWLLAGWRDKKGAAGEDCAGLVIANWYTASQTQGRNREAGSGGLLWYHYDDVEDPNAARDARRLSG